MSIGGNVGKDRTKKTFINIVFTTLALKLTNVEFAPDQLELA
jgi:hypothetical protein